MTPSTFPRGILSHCHHRHSRSFRNHVDFSTVEVREYNQTVGDNPCCSYGPPISLDWDYVCCDGPVDILTFEANHAPHRSRRGLLINYYQRRDRLLLAGITPEELDVASREVGRERFRRSVTLSFLPVFIAEEKVILAADRIYSSSAHRHHGKKSRVIDRDKDGASKDDRSTSNVSSSGVVSDSSGERPVVDAELGVRSIMRQLSMDISLHSTAGSRRYSVVSQATAAGECETDDHDHNGHPRDNDDDDPYVPTQDSKFDRYQIRVDRSQHDRATEIQLCSLARPHMRAFHASWFAFFVAFFAWFAITPLLGEVQYSLNLTKEQIWTSSLCGTAGTIITRIFIGPACDKFGARVCMAFVLIVSAIPTALTGLVQTSTGLCTVRAFIGIAGSSFVACQYWTSSMFTRERVGTANALVAGWGNLGGGVAQVVMGSVLFPLFKVIYGGGDDDDDDSREKAWRTVFVVPAVLSIVTAFLIVKYCDDSPKGDYRERVRQQEITIVSPCDSFSASVLNWNVWALALQYACCFGVEVTMTNATALYVREHFGQETESAAAIASIFGIMNLFARGLGGLGSDVSNMMGGMKGRLAWQFVTLLVQGAAIVIFAFAKTLPGAIFALIFASIMVQSAEGSTFGIVPYVSRRYTGGVVGFVGAGGNVGGVIFAIMFISFPYQKAFYLMGASAALSSILSFSVRIKGKGLLRICDGGNKPFSGARIDGTSTSA